MGLFYYRGSKVVFDFYYLIVQIRSVIIFILSRCLNKIKSDVKDNLKLKNALNLRD